MAGAEEEVNSIFNLINSNNTSNYKLNYNGMLQISLVAEVVGVDAADFGAEVLVVDLLLPRVPVPPGSLKVNTRTLQ